jgi:uncharacterized protein YndB with AHSA1/START domain
MEIETPPGEPVIVVRAHVAAPPELVFRLYTEPEHLRRWYGPRHLELSVCEVDLRVGGRYRFVHRAPDGQEFGFSGSFLEVDRPRRLVRTFTIEDWPHGEAIETITFEGVGHGTSVHTRTVHPSVAARDAHVDAGMARGMNDAHSRLEELIP